MNIQLLSGKMKEFYRKDLDTKALARKALDEAKLIHSKPSTARGRSLREIYATTVYGLSPEQYLIEKCNFTNDSRMYKDVISPQGIPVEVKTTEGEYYTYHVLKRCNSNKLEVWRNYPDWVFIYINDKTNDHYTLHNTYKWNGKLFARCHFESDVSLQEDIDFLANIGDENASW